LNPSNCIDPQALQVRGWRCELQRTFLGRVIPAEKEMAHVDSQFSAIENFDNMTLDYLIFSKLGKVLRHIHRLASRQVPRDDLYNFRGRAKALVEKWYKNLTGNRPP
ncbi:hypothetical protein B0H13DRAFT_1584345, partial [Mycena leptocephala]